MYAAIRTLVQEFGWIHTGLGLFGNFTFVVGSVFFLPTFEAWKTFGVWLFIVGAVFMFVGALGNMLVKVYEARAEHPRNRETMTHTKEHGRRENRQAA
jgi:hypothetical protein